MESHSPRLDGWKAIADYLDRDQRTAQRWLHRGLPVHAIPGGKRATDFAFGRELDDWMTGADAATKRERPATLLL